MGAKINPKSEKGGTKTVEQSRARRAYPLAQVWGETAHNILHSALPAKTMPKINAEF